MTKKDFQAIADIIHSLPDDNRWELAQNRRIALRFADYLASTNPRFDRDRFLAACGVEA